MDPPPHATPMPADSWIIARCDGPVCVGALHVGGCELVTVRTLPRSHRSFSRRRRSSSPASPLISDCEADPVQSCHSKQTSEFFCTVVNKHGFVYMQFFSLKLIVRVLKLEWTHWMHLQALFSVFWDLRWHHSVVCGFLLYLQMKLLLVTRSAF